MSSYADPLRFLDAKTRRKLLDKRRMRFRRAIESYEETLRLRHDLSDYPDLAELGGLLAYRTVLLQSVLPAR